MSIEKILIFLPDASLAQWVEHSALGTAGYNLVQVADLAALKSQIQSQSPDVVILGDDMPADHQRPPPRLWRLVRHC
jgi:DNA-binding response OmpR family regulator